MCSHDHMIMEDVLWFIPVDPSQNSSSSQLNLSVLIKQMLMETLWVERQRSFNSCPVHEPLNWLCEFKLAAFHIGLSRSTSSEHGRAGGRAERDLWGKASELLFSISWVSKFRGSCCVKMPTIEIWHMSERSGNQDQCSNTSEAQHFNADLWQPLLPCECRTYRQSAVVSQYCKEILLYSKVSGKVETIVFSHLEKYLQFARYYYIILLVKQH